VSVCLFLTQSLFIPENCSCYKLDIDKVNQHIQGQGRNIAAFFVHNKSKVFSIKTATHAYLTNCSSCQVQIIHVTDLFHFFIQRLSFFLFSCFSLLYIFLLQMGCVVSAYKNPSPPVMFKFFGALQTNYVRERCCVFRCLKIQITQFLPSFSCSFTVPDYSLNCYYNSDRHARIHARLDAQDTHTLLSVSLSSIIHCIQRHKELNTGSPPPPQLRSFHFLSFVSLTLRSTLKIMWWRIKLWLNVSFVLRKKFI